MSYNFVIFFFLWLLLSITVYTNYYVNLMKIFKLAYLLLNGLQDTFTLDANKYFSYKKDKFVLQKGSCKLLFMIICVSSGPYRHMYRLPFNVVYKYAQVTIMSFIETWMYK